MSVVAYFFIHNYPTTAKFLTPNERKYALVRLKDDSDATRSEKFTWTGVRQAFVDSKIYLRGLYYLTVSVPGYMVSLFLPTIISGLGNSATQAHLLSIPPMYIAVLAEGTKQRAPFITGSSVVEIIGYIVLLISRWPGMSYVGTTVVVVGIFPTGPIILGCPANNVSGQTKRATANTMQIAIGNLGVIMGTQLYWPKWNPRRFVGHGAARPFAIRP